MLFVLIGVAMIIGNLASVGPTADWTWNFTGDLWKFCAPFGLALVWWIWTDATGYDKRRAMERMDAKRQKRREEQLQSLGMDTRGRRARQPGR